MTKQLQLGSAGKKDGSHAFLCLGDLLACFGRMDPGRTAVLAPECPPMTYGALWTQAKYTARRLRSFGVGRCDRVAVVLPNGAEAAVGMIAVAASAVCVPLNPGLTADELRRYFGDLRISAVLTRLGMDSGPRSVAANLGIPVVNLSPRPRERAGAFHLVASVSERIVDRGFASSANDAFILLTSGTSSRPKIVPLTHAAVCMSGYNVGAALALGPRDRLLNVLPLFHVHGLVSGLVAALAAGSSVVCTHGFDATGFFGWLKEFRPTWYTAVPAIHRAVLSAAGGANRSSERYSLRLVRSASSLLPSDVTSGLESLFGVPVIDTYGMTEAASQIAANPLGRRKPGSVGRSAGAEIAIMDREGRRLPPGKRGEVVLRGPTITRGYDNDAAATESAFRDGWFRTGDLGYLDRDGFLFIVGRIKDIINRGGQKVAPAEVEEALLRHPDVVEAAAFSTPHKRLGEDVAAAVVLRTNVKVSAQKLRNFAREHLAGFKVPGVIYIVPQIPKTAAGKIKRGELVATLSMSLPRERVKQSGKVDAPSSDLAWQLADIWTQLLELNKVDIDEDVFVLGADSITVTLMLSRLRARFGVDMSLKDIFLAPTSAALAARLKTLKGDSASVSFNLSDPQMKMAGMRGDGPKPVSIMQEHVLRIEQELPGLPQFNLPFAYRLQGPLNIPALERGLAEVVRRHDSLRTRFAWLDESPVALVTPAVDVNSILVIENLATREQTGNDRTRALLLKRVELVVEQETLRSFDMNRASLFRAHLWPIGADDHILLLNLHDMIVDGWSMDIFMEEVSELYAAFTAGRPAQLLDPVLQFSDFARWQRWWSTSGAAAQQSAYWKQRLQEFSPIFPKNGDAADAVLSLRISREPIHISTDLIPRLSTLSHSQGATLFMTLLAGFKTLLLIRTGRNDICVATAMANRGQPGTERVVGPIGNTTLIRTRINANLSFREALSRVRDSVIEAHARQELPFDIVANQLANEYGLDPGSLIQTSFVLQNAFRRSLELTDVAVQPFVCPEGRPVMPIDRTWLGLTLRETPAGITGTCNYNDGLFEPNVVRRWIADYQTILVKAVANPETSLGQFADVE